MSEGVSALGLVRAAVAVRRWLVDHFDVVAASWLIVLAFAWAIYLASMSARTPSDWTGPLIGGGDWSSTVISAPADSPSAAQR